MRPRQPWAAMCHKAIFDTAVNCIDRKHTFARRRNVAAGLQLVGTIGGVVLPVATELPQRRRTEAAEVDPIFQRSRVSGAFGIADAAVHSLNWREGERRTHRIVVDDTVLGERGLPENRQSAVGRRADAEITLAIVPLSRSTRIGPGGLLVKGDAGVRGS